MSDFYIGRTYGAAPLGSYNIAYELAHLPSTEIGAPINRALLPGFAKMGPGEDVKSAYGTAVGLLALFALPAAALIFALAPFLVPVLLGPKWLDTVPLMQVLAFNGALLLFQASISTVLMGRGFPLRVCVANTTYVLVLAMTLVMLTSRFGLIGAAYAALLTSILCTPVYLYQVRRGMGIEAGVFLKAIACPLVSALVTSVILKWALPAHEPSMGWLGASGWLLLGSAAGACFYALLVLSLWRLRGSPAGAERAVIERAKLIASKRFGKWFTKPPQ